MAAAAPENWTLPKWIDYLPEQYYLDIVEDQGSTNEYNLREILSPDTKAILENLTTISKKKIP